MLVDKFFSLSDVRDSVEGEKTQSKKVNNGATEPKTEKDNRDNRPIGCYHTTLAQNVLAWGENGEGMVEEVHRRVKKRTLETDRLEKWRRTVDRKVGA